MSQSQSPIIGIDLGTTNSVVAAIIDGIPRVLEEDGETILPSVVAINTDGQLVTGVVARNQLAVYPERTAVSIKRRMGTMEPVPLGDQSFTPPEISAMILRRLRDRATRALGREVNRAVITVPAFFDDQQRQATREAGDLAGLTVERIINEPTAATLVYHAGSRDRKQILVYDFGGGTFDVSVVRMEAGIVEVLSSKGDTQLGGDDLDRLLLDHVADDFREKHGIDLRQNAATRFRLLQACENAKCRLSIEESVRIAEEFIAEKNGSPLNLDLTIHRSEFEELIEPLIERTIGCVDDALRGAGLTTHQLDDLVLVGGSTRVPLVESRLRDEFQREPSRAVNPDLAVALGAAVQAAMIDGEAVGPVLVDVTGHTLGIEACEGGSFFDKRIIFSPIIRRNSALPARYEESYSTVHDDQEAADIHVLQGEHADVHRNRSLGNCRIDLEPGGGERSKIVVRFDLNLDGILNVTATQPATGKTKELIIDNALSQFRADERDRAEARLGALFESSDELLRDAPSVAPSSAAERTGADDATFPEAVKLLERAEAVKSSVNADDADDLQSIAENLRQAIAANDEGAVISLSEELEDILFYVG